MASSKTWFSSRSYEIQRSKYNIFLDIRKYTSECIFSQQYSSISRVTLSQISHFASTIICHLILDTSHSTSSTQASRPSNLYSHLIESTITITSNVLDAYGCECWCPTLHLARAGCTVHHMYPLNELRMNASCQRDVFPFRSHGLVDVMGDVQHWSNEYNRLGEENALDMWCQEGELSDDGIWVEWIWDVQDKKTGIDCFPNWWFRHDRQTGELW